MKVLPTFPAYDRCKGAGQALLGHAEHSHQFSQAQDLHQGMTTKYKRILWFGIPLALLLALVIAVLYVPAAKTILSLIVWRLRGRTGTIYHVENGKTFKDHYKNGLPDGIWTIVDKQGHLLSSSEYRNGQPWNGICYMRYGKAWLGDYRNGAPWYGCYPQYDEKTSNWDDRFFLNGKEVSYEEYCKSRGLDGPGHIFYGIHHVTDQKVKGAGP